MKQARYKVETFIIPEGNQCPDRLVTNEERDGKITNKLKKKVDREYIVNTTVFKTTANEGQCRFPVTRLKECCAILKKDTEKVRALNNISISQMQMHRLNSLSCIDEKPEDMQEKRNDICYHGNKNGCTVPAPLPEDLSEDIFRENWLNRLEILQNREGALNDKEIALQSRERLLFQKERDLRILERQLKEKITQIEQHLKRIQQSHKVNSKGIENVTEYKSSSESSRSHSSSTVYSSNSKASAESHLPDKLNQDICEYRQQEMLHKNIAHGNGSEAKKESTAEIKHSQKQTLCENNISATQIGIKNVMNSMLLHHPSSLSVPNPSNLQPSYYHRTRQRSKIIYDDLDSTLSADIGDSSFIQTAKIFNPADYKKPFAFSRSASERRPKHTTNNDSLIAVAKNVNTLKENPLPLGSVEEHNIFKRVSDNITASCSGSTIFQDYGLIDEQLATSKSQIKANALCDDKRYSYLNLELEQKSTQSKKAKCLKERPISWCEETNEWLQKKRQAYNLTTKRMVMEDFDNKENANCNVKRDGIDKSSQKKDARRKMFTIFR